MTTPQIALLALAIGLAIGIGLAALIFWAYQARAKVVEDASTEVPQGTADVLDSMDDAACVIDSSGLVLAISHAATRFGIEIGTTLDNQELRQLVRAVRSSGASAIETMRLTRPGVSLDPRLVSARASRLGARLTLLIIRDVTEQERLDQVRRDFVANTSHELKTPVGAVSLLAEAVESAADDPAQVRIFAARLSAEAARLGQLTGRIMSLSRLQAATASPTLTRCRWTRSSPRPSKHIRSRRTPPVSTSREAEIAAHSSAVTRRSSSRLSATSSPTRSCIRRADREWLSG
ncbi:histidine kinase dimerization/phospho-acceptor domain-containing protein [Microbacterium sp. CH12i]|uniref:histidine kinase dimerization/phospho-acceptor domain-containing protein n=1 Tax=Microbacterium sp. CH12i TaxID=1479651 RepID=UPI002E13A33A